MINNDERIAIINKHLEKGVEIKPKDFAVGVRIEHLQSKINEYAEFLPQQIEQTKYSVAGGVVVGFCL